MKASNYPSVCKRLVDNDWDPTDAAPDKEAVIVLMKKYLNEDVKDKKDKEKLDACMTPRKFRIEHDEEKFEYKYDKKENDKELVEALIDKLSEIGIFIENDENAETNVLRVVEELADAVKSIADSQEFVDQEQADDDVDSFVENNEKM